MELEVKIQYWISLQQLLTRVTLARLVTTMVQSFVSYFHIQNNSYASLTQLHYIGEKTVMAGIIL